MNAEEYILSSSGLGLPDDPDHHNNNQAVMNEKVQSLAGSIYEEFESMIIRYDTDVVKSLMPLIVNVLESLDLSYTEIQEYEVELELLKEDNEQLVTQYEREKALRKGAESKNIEFEDNFDGERKDLNVKIDSITSTVKMFELKAKNNQEHINRLEEKENEMKREYSKLHDRYTELFKTHIDYMERAKNFLGSEKMEQMHGPASSSRNQQNRISALNQLNRSSGPISFGYTELEGNNNPIQSILHSGISSENCNSDMGNDKSTNLRNELIGANDSSSNQPKRMVDKGQSTDIMETTDHTNTTGDVALTQSDSKSDKPDENVISTETIETATTVALESTPTDNSQNEQSWIDNGALNDQIIDLEGEETEDITHDPNIGPVTPTSPVKMGLSQTKVETRTGNTLYQELSFQDADALGDVDEGADITGGWVHPGEFASADQDFDDSSCFSLEDNIMLVNDNYFGMGKEVENLISENNELLATKNALNIVKDDLIAKVDELTGEHEILREEIKSLQKVRSRCQTRIAELEEEVKKLKEDVQAKSKANKNEADDEDVPMAQRKRFTRVEMARVLMERNQYKEKFMELQDAVRWTEIMRANRNENPIVKKTGRLGILKFFGNLFSANDSNFENGGNKPLIPYVNMKYSNEGVSSNDRKGERRGFSSSRNNELFDGESLTNARRNFERKEQYKQVRAHVKKDDGRTQAYGWSLPVHPEGPSSVDGVTSSTHGGNVPSHSSANNGIPVPVPVYCQPLMKKEPGMKIWCAAGVNLTGGRSFKKESSNSNEHKEFTDPSSGSSSILDDSKVVVSEKEAANLDAIRACNNELEQINKELNSEGKSFAEEAAEVNEELSSHIWICTSTHSISKVTVIDANDPGNVLESFHVCSSHLLCIASVPGTKDTDFNFDEEFNKKAVSQSQSRVMENDKSAEEDKSEDSLEDDPTLFTSLRFVSTSQEDASKGKENEETGNKDEEAEEMKSPLSRAVEAYNIQDFTDDFDESHSTLPFISHQTFNLAKAIEKETQEHEEDVDAVHRRFLKDQDTSHMKNEGENSSNGESQFEDVEKMSSVLPTMWLGSQSGSIYVHSAVSQWKRCIHSIKLSDSVLCILHIKGRVLVALANGTIAIFHRAPDGQWDLDNYHLLDLGKPRFSIRCMTQVHDRVWCGYRNKVFIIDPQAMSVQHTFDAHPRKESQVRQMACFEDGVWVSIRLDSTLRLYHAHTYQHLQDVDIEPYVSKMLGPAKYGFSFVRITSLLISCHRLWMGTGNGVIISVPFVSMELLSACNSQTNASNSTSGSLDKKLPGGLVRVYSSGEKSQSKKFIPYCSLSQAQLSFHGHRDSVKFFVSVPGNENLANTSLSPSTPITGDTMLVVSGGEGYIDFRLDECDTEELGRPDGHSKNDQSHLVIWSAKSLEKSKTCS